MPGEILLKVAIDLGVDTPDFIPSIPTFKNALKAEYKTAYDTFNKAYKQIETDPSTAIGLANSALESIIKEILKDHRISAKVKGSETLYKLSSIILKEFNLTNTEHPKEIKTIGNSLLAINQAIEKLRSEKTNFHGKTSEDYLIEDSILGEPLSYTVLSDFTISNIQIEIISTRSRWKKIYYYTIYCCIQKWERCNDVALDFVGTAIQIIVKREPPELKS